MASVAIATTPRVSLFDSPNENITAKCLMAKATNKVTPNIKTTIINHPSPTDSINEFEGANVEANKFEAFMGKLKGKSKKHFVALLEQLGEANDMIEAHEDTISKMEGIVMTMPMRSQIFPMLLKKSVVFVWLLRSHTTMIMLN
jgi:hypothetical protein